MAFVWTRSDSAIRMDEAIEDGCVIAMGFVYLCFTWDMGNRIDTSSLAIFILFGVSHRVVAVLCDVRIISKLSPRTPARDHMRVMCRYRG